MPDFNEQLANIARLRVEARRHDEALYQARIGLRGLEQRRGRAEQGRTVPAAERDDEVQRLRARMADLNGSIATLRQQERAIALELAQIAEQERLVAQLRQQISSLRRRADAIGQERVELQEQHPAPRDELERLAAELESLAARERELEDALRAAIERLEGSRQRLQELQRQQAAIRARIVGLRADLQGLQDRISELLQPIFDDRQTIDRAIAQLENQAERSRENASRATHDLASAIGDLYREDPHPRRSLARLDDQVPFLLFPLRIETVFATVRSPQGVPGTELQVRIYPDDILVHTHEAMLTDREVDAGRLYWVELVVAAHLRSRREQRQTDAWSHVVTLFGGQRAAWVARNTKPADWDDAVLSEGAKKSLIQFLHDADATFFAKLTALPLSTMTRGALTKAVKDDDGDAFFDLAASQSWGERINAVARTQITGFPAAGITRTDAWSRAPRTRVLPDRFVLLLYPTVGAPPREVTGALIPDTVFLGPDPLDPDATLMLKGNTRTLGGTCEWMSNFDTAVAQGLAFRVPLSEEQADGGFARIVVLGLRLSAGAAHGAELVEELISDHQFSPSGFSLVAQGTPTNNTEHNGTGYSDNDPYDELAFFTGIAAPAFEADSTDPLRSQTDGRLLADALGISYAPLQTVQNGDRTDILEASAMNTALYPATLGYWLKNWMSPVVTAKAARLARSFFTRHVTGRGPLPAIRVGNQPYGVLVTSDMSRWKYPTLQGPFATIALLDDETPFLRELHALLLQLERRWTAHSEEVAHVGKPGSDSSDMLMKMLGLHPTSVEFYQRIGFSASYLKDLQGFTRPGSTRTNELASLISSMPPTARLFLRGLGVEREIGVVAQMLALSVLWQHYTSSLDVPNLVEAKPVSEVATLAFNYIDWLAKADSPDKIISEQFTGAKPVALLYLMLRNAVLLQLHQGSYEWLKERSDFEPALVQALKPSALMGVSAASPNISKVELMAVLVQAVQSDHPAPGMSVADWIWSGPTPAEAEGAFVKEQRTAMEQLAKAPTARLERCLIEHLDCCQYRLDAWETGLFAHRLQAQRRTGSPYLERQTGLHLGAYGWVEGVKRAPRTAVRREELPDVLRPDDDRPLLEEDDVATSASAQPGSRRGGFTHAPSINHAAAAALLRNAYLSHASSEQADMLSNNLSSERVRRAAFVLEGLRNGQPVEALLGYQFERALHDLTSESAARGDSPVLELNEFIQPYRQAFPLESREIPQAGTGPATETVPPYSVVNGLALSRGTLDASNGFGLAAVLAPPELPNSSQGAAIVAVQVGLAETIDAVKDVLMAENAYQLVQGNFDRVAAVSLAQKDARIPPSLEVLNTPRGSQFTFTNRVTLHFDDLDASLAASNPWSGVDMTPRALAEPGLNFWLGTVLGLEPESVTCEVWRAQAGSDTRLDLHAVTLRSLGLQPLDFVAVTGINVNESQGGVTELETRIAAQYRHAHAIAMDATVRIDFDPAGVAGGMTFGRLFPLARRLRALLAECRALGAQDFLPAAGGKASAVVVDPDNPSGYDVAELRTRVQAASLALQGLADALDGPTAPDVSLLLLHDAADAGDDEPFAGGLGDAFVKLDDAGTDFTDTAAVQVAFSLPDAQALHFTLRRLALFGVSDAYPPETDLTSDGARLALLSRARRVARRLRRAEPKDGVLDRAAALMAAATTDQPAVDQTASLLQAAQALFSDTLKLLPHFACSNEVDLAASDAARGELLSHALSVTPGITGDDLVDEWLQGLARVRPRLQAWETVRTLTDALSDVALTLRPVQVPFRHQDRWLAVQFPDKDPLDPKKRFGISRDTLSIAAHGSAAFRAGVAQRGLLLDEWTEEIPSASENTGISFRFNQPNAVPPQAILLAVTPEETGSWSWDALVGTLNDTLARAKRRAVEPAQLEEEGLVWNALSPALVSEFSMLWQADVSLDYLVAVKYQALNELYTSLEKR